MLQVDPRPRGQLVHIECRAFYHGVRHLVKEKRGLVHFEVLLTWAMWRHLWLPTSLFFWKDMYHTVYCLQDERNPQWLCYPFMLHFVFAWKKKKTENIINQLRLRFPARNIVQISKRDSPWNQIRLTRSRWPACSGRLAPAPRWGSLAFRMSWSTLFLKEYVF